MEVNTNKVTKILDKLYLCGKQDDGTYTRMAYSKEDVAARNLFQGCFQELGIPVKMDKAGNLIARLEGSEPNLPAIILGSHLDTVPDGGKYDGVLGCVSALGVCEALVRAGKKLRHPLEVMVFTDEEGFRFGNGLLGSSAFCGEDPKISPDDLDIYGQMRKEVFQTYGITAEEVTEAKRDPKTVHCFIELHVEQGSTLYKKQVPIGIVSSIAGVSRYEVQIDGQANHAGSTRMEDRKDALVTASKLIASIPETVKKLGGAYTVATVGTIKVAPNSVNVIPGSCTFQLEIRDQDAGVMKKIEEELQKELQRLCKEAKATLHWKQISYHEPAPMSPEVQEAIKKAVEKRQIDYMVLPSGAFHDSLLMTHVFPTGMIFVPSEEGISHSRYEYTKEEDIHRGCQVLLEAVVQADQMEIHPIS